jgi:serine/threonine protein kinase
MEGSEAHHEVDESPVGQTLDQWRIVRLIGRGGMSTVYEAVQPDGVRVALKRLNPVLARSPNARARFLREGRVANAVGHPNAVRVLDTHVTADGQLFLVMELLEGQTLRDRCSAAGGRLEPREVLDVCSRVLEVLGAAHAKSIFHRDVKPENVFLTARGDVKVLDFGIAAVRDEAIEDAHITQSGASLGTPAFMAPEQARGRQAHVDARTDVWAVGATMFLCLTGRRVHEDATNANEALIFAATQRARALATVCPNVADDIAFLVDRALALDPADRWPSAEAMLGAIALAQHSSASTPRVPRDSRGVDATRDETPSASAVHGPRRRVTVWPRVALVLAMLAAGGLTVRALSKPRRIDSVQAPLPTPEMRSAPPALAGAASAMPVEPVRPIVAPAAPRPAASAKVVRVPPGTSVAPAASDSISEIILDRRK